MSILVRERAPLRLSINVATPSGHLKRWGPDERDPANAPDALSFSTTMPGGFEQLSCTLPRRPDLSYSDLEELSTLTVRGPGGQVAWEGRLEKSPRTSGDQMSVSPQAVGWQAALSDDNSAAMIYIDRDLSRWISASVQRQLNLVGASVGLNVFSFASQPDESTGQPSLMFTAAGGWTGNQFTEAWYDAGGAGGIGLVRWQKDLFIGIGGSDPHVTNGVYALADDVASSFTGSNLDVTPNGAGSFGPFSPNQWRYALLQCGYNTAGGTTDATYGYAFQNLAVIGTHGLTLHAGATGASPGPDDGLLASDVVAHAVGKWAPELTFTTGAGGTVPPSVFVIPHLVFATPTTAADIIKAATAFELPDWAVWDNLTFYCAPRGTFGRNWRTRVQPSQLQETGPDVARIWNGVIVTFTDVTGIQRSVGPPGSGCTVEDASLADPDPLNPANELGIRRWSPPLQMGTSAGIFVKPDAAIQAGRTLLQEQKLLDTSGQANLVGHVEDDHGVLWPAWMVRAGDTLTEMDAADTSPRRVIRTSWDDTSKTNSVSLDAPPDGMQALLARLSLSITSQGFS